MNGTQWCTSAVNQFSLEKTVTSNEAVYTPNYSPRYTSCGLHNATISILIMTSHKHNLSNQFYFSWNKKRLSGGGKNYVNVLIRPFQFIMRKNKFNQISSMAKKKRRMIQIWKHSYLAGFYVHHSTFKKAPLFTQDARYVGATDAWCDQLETFIKAKLFFFISTPQIEQAHPKIAPRLFLALGPDANSNTNNRCVFFDVNKYRTYSSIKFGMQSDQFHPN